MARKIKFPLIMENDVKVRSLEALKENFDIYQVFTYYRSGKLLLWLKNIYLDEEADKVKNLDSTEDIPLLSRQLYEVFGLPNTAIDEEKVEKIQDRENRKKRLQEKTSNDEILERIDEVAFDNEELDMRLKEGCKEIFLCGEAFTIPVEFENVTYYGVNKPVVSLNTEWVDLDEKKIRFKDIKPDYSLIRNNRIKNGRKCFYDEYSKDFARVVGADEVKQLYRKIVHQIQACHREVSDQVLRGEGKKETRKISIALNDFCKLDKYEFKYQPSIHDVTGPAFDACGILANSIIYYITSSDCCNCREFNEKYNEFKKGNSFDCWCNHMCFCVEKLPSNSRKPSDYKGMDKVVALRFVFFFLYCILFQFYWNGGGTERLTKACELALCMELSEDEVLDLVTVLLIINGLQESSKEQFKTDTVWDNFNCVLDCGYIPLPEEEKPTDTQQQKLVKHIRLFPGMD